MDSPLEQMPEWHPVKEPQIPNQEFTVTDYGAVPDGRTDNTDAFCEAIKACAAAGGGRVRIPRGFWLTGPIELESNIDLHTEAGALVVFQTDLAAYPLRSTSYEGLKAIRCMAPITGRNLVNIAITGRGVFDGSGGAWRPIKRFKMTPGQWEALKTTGYIDEQEQIWWPSKEAGQARVKLQELAEQKGTLDCADYEPYKRFLRPNLVELTNCRQVLLEGASFQNSPSWCIHPIFCEEITIRGITVRNPWYAQNGDGLDLDSCRHAQVLHCSFDVGDDAICLKSGKDAAGRARKAPCEYIRVEDCTVYHGHGGFTIGSEMSSGVRAVEVKDCTFIGTDVGLRFKSTRGRGGIVEDIWIDNINMVAIAGAAISFNMFYGRKQHDAAEVSPSEETPIFRRINVSNTTCRGAGQAGLLEGLPEMPIQDITLNHVALSAQKGLCSSHARRIRLHHVAIETADGPAFETAETAELECVNETPSS